MTVAVAHVSPPAATAEGRTGALASVLGAPAPVAFKLVERRSIARDLDRNSMVSTPGIDVCVRNPSATGDRITALFRGQETVFEDDRHSYRPRQGKSGGRNEPEVADDVDDEVGGPGSLSTGRGDRAVGADLHDRVVGPGLARAVVDRGSDRLGDSQRIDQDVARRRGLRDSEVDGDRVGLRRDAAGSQHDEAAGAAG